MEEKTKKYFKIVLGVIGTVFLGAIGSGLWERIFSPSVDTFVRASIEGINWIFSTYKDSIYQEAAKGFHEVHSLSLYGIVLSILPLAYLWILRRHPTQKGKENKS